jgi:hypothetical protein
MTKRLSSQSGGLNARLLTVGICSVGLLVAAPSFIGMQPKTGSIRALIRPRPGSTESAFGGVEARLFSLGNLPLSFERNVGQTDPAARFVAHTPGVEFFFAPSEIICGDLRMKIMGGNPAPELTGIDLLPGRSNYFIGNDPTKWKTDVPHYAQVEYAGVYPGVDLIFHGNQRQLEYDFVVAPGADPGRIRLAFKGAAGLRIDKDRELIVTTKNGHEIHQYSPAIYQEIDGARRKVPGGYVIKKGTREVGFKVSAYDRNRPLVIDPVLAYSTYLGGTTASPGSPIDSGAQAIAVDTAGNIYVTGFTSTTDFPTANPEQPVYGGGLYDVFVTKIGSSGSTLIYSTYLGGMNDEKAFAIAVDSAGSAYITGFTQSPNFPTTPTAFQPVSTTGILPTNSSDAFVTKLSPGGNALVYSTFLGGNTNAENGFGIAVDSSGSAYVTGTTASIDFPTKNPYQPMLSSGGLRVDAFVTKFSPDGTGLVYSTYLGGGGSGGGLSESGINEGYGIAVDSSGSAYVTGTTDSSAFPTQNPLQPNLAGDFDIFVTKFSPAGNTLVYSTYLGGSKAESGFGIAVDSSANAYITGKTASLDFPTVNAFQPGFAGGNEDAFVAKFNPDGSALVYSTYLGGSGSEGNLSRIVLDSSGNAYIVGSTDSTNFPTANAIQSARAGPGDNAFITKLNAAGKGLIYSTYLGGNSLNLGFGIAADAAGNAYIAGQTWSGNFPTVNPFQGSLRGTDDAFIAKIVQLPVQLTGVVSRKTHGSAGTFDVDLPLTGTRGIECRSGGANGDYTLVFTFANTLTSVGSASVTNGSGSVVMNNIDSNDAHNYIVNLTGVTNAQVMTVSLSNVSDSAGNFSSAISATMGVLVGDTNGDGFVNSADIGQTKSQSGQPVGASNFREDVNADGFLNSGDIGFVKSKSGTALP